MAVDVEVLTSQEVEMLTTRSAVLLAVVILFAGCRGDGCGGGPESAPGNATAEKAPEIADQQTAKAGEVLHVNDSTEAPTVENVTTEKTPQATEELRRQAIDALLTSDLASARSLVAEAQGKAVDHPDVAETMAMLAVALGRWDVVEAELKTVISGPRPRAATLASYAYALARLGDCAAARAYSERAVSALATLPPDQEQADSFQEDGGIRRGDTREAVHYNYGLALSECGSPKEALEQYQKAKQYDASRPELHNDIGEANRELGNTAAAEKAYEEALRLDPKLAKARGNLGLLRVDQQCRLEDGIKMYEMAAEIDPQLSAVQFNLCFSYLIVGEPEKARKACARYLKLKPTAEDASEIRTIADFIDKSSSGAVHLAQTEHARRCPSSKVGPTPPAPVEDPRIQTVQRRLDLHLVKLRKQSPGLRGFLDAAFKPTEAGLMVDAAVKKLGKVVEDGKGHADMFFSQLPDKTKVGYYVEAIPTTHLQAREWLDEYRGGYLSLLGKLFSGPTGRMADVLVVVHVGSGHTCEWLTMSIISVREGAVDGLVLADLLSDEDKKEFLSE
jgi:tetratricopeptide (TPR) repeat protein